MKCDAIVNSCNKLMSFYRSAQSNGVSECINLYAGTDYQDKCKMDLDKYDNL